MAESEDGIGSHSLASRLKPLVDSPRPMAFNAMGLQPVDSFGGARLDGVCGGLGPLMPDVGIGLVVGVDGVGPSVGG